QAALTRRWRLDGGRGGHPSKTTHLRPFWPDSEPTPIIVGQARRTSVSLVLWRTISSVSGTTETVVLRYVTRQTTSRAGCRSDDPGARSAHCALCPLDRAVRLRRDVPFRCRLFGGV